MQDEPKKIGLVWPLIIICAIAIPTVLGMILIGNEEQERADRIDAKATILVSALAVSLVVISSSFPIRQWRRQDDTGERHYTHDGTKVIKEVHYGAPPRYADRPQLAEPFAFPAMTRAAYEAGALNRQPQGQRYVAMPAQAEPAADNQDDVWNMPAQAWDGDDVPTPAGWDGEIVQ